MTDDPPAQTDSAESAVDHIQEVAYDAAPELIE